MSPVGILVVIFLPSALCHRSRSMTPDIEVDFVVSMPCPAPWHPLVHVAHRCHRDPAGPVIVI
ncbi:MAG: hypothetical protein WCO57_13180, partial [Verrucomicrobiota bacterium]